MKIGINILPLKTGHKVRGVGYYTHNLIHHLREDESVEVVEFTDSQKVDSVDIVHYPWFDFYFHSLPIKKRFKTVVTIHDTIPLLFPGQYPVGLKGKINFLLQKIALKGADAVITDSEASKRDIIKYLKIRPNKIYSILLAADDSFRLLADTKLIQIKKKLNLPDRYLLYVGDANWVKNLPFLIEGFINLTKNPENKELNLVLVGGVFLKNVEKIDHPELESLKKVKRMIMNPDIKDKIIITGNIEKDDLIGVYNLATVYIQPSLYEGFGFPVLEAMACGAPVACSSNSSLPEVGKDAVVYFDPKNLIQFVGVVNQILQDKSLRKKLSGLGLRRARDFSWRKVASQTITVYNEVMNER